MTNAPTGDVPEPDANKVYLKPRPGESKEQFAERFLSLILKTTEGTTADE